LAAGGPGLAAVLVAAFYGYLLGSLPFAVLFGLLRRKNLLKEGSGNPGAVNAFRVLGVVPGLMVLFLDVTKGFLAVALGEVKAGVPGALAAGAAAVWGHAFSPFLGFRGGKGIATAIGAGLAVSPQIVFLAVLAFLGFYLIFRHVYRAVFFASLALPLLVLLFTGEVVLAVFTLFAVFPVAIRHVKDLSR